MKNRDVLTLQSLYESRILLGEANLADDKPLIAAIDELLKGKGIPSGSAADNWFKTQYLRWFKSPEGDEKKSKSPHQYQEGEPEWMSKEGVVDFKGWNSHEKEELGHIADYIMSLPEVDQKSVYKIPYADMVGTHIPRWNEEMSKQVGKKASSMVEGKDFVVIEPAQGYNGKWVKLISERCYQYEGEYMGHCVGKGEHGYHPKNKNVEIWSLYDKNNSPHVTLEIQKGKKINQIKGKQNTRPVEEYQPATRAFIRKLVDQGYTVTGDGRNVGMIGWNEKFYFEESPQWKQVFEKEVLPKRERVFAEIQSRIVEVPDKPSKKKVAKESFDFRNDTMRNFEKIYETVMGEAAVETAPAPTTTPTTPSKPANPIRKPAPGQKTRPKAKAYFDKLKAKYNL